MDFGILTSHIKSDEQNFNFSTPVTVVTREGDKVYSSYTLTKLTASVEKKIVNFFQQNKKGTVHDILASSIIRLDGNDVSRFITQALLRQVPAEIMEEIFVNLRVLTYGTEIKANFKCKHQVMQKDSDGRYIKNSEGDVVLGDCGVENTVIVEIDSNFYKSNEQLEEDQSFDNTVEVPLQGEGDKAVVTVKTMFSTATEKMLINKLSSKQRDSFQFELMLISMMDSIEVSIDGEVSLLKPSIEDFFNKDGGFTPTGTKAKEFISFFNIIPINLRDEIKEKSLKFETKNSQFNLGYTGTCRACKKEHKGTIDIIDSSFLLPAWGK